MILKPNDLVFDIGAHFGESARMFLAGGAGRVVCVEPNWRAVESMRKSSPNNVRVVWAACSDDDVNELAWYEAKNDDGRSTVGIEKWLDMYGDREEFTRKATVPTTTIDVLAQHHGRPDYVKIDVEGFGLRVLDGMTFKPRALTIEFHKHDSDTLATARRLIQLGFSKYAITDEIDLEAEPNKEILFLIKMIEDDELPAWGNWNVT